MKNLFMIIPLIILLNFSFSCRQSEEVAEKARPVVDVEADIKAIKDEIVNPYQMHMNSGDFEQWIALWADDGVRMPADSPPIIGKEQIREGLESVFEEMILDLTITSVFRAEVYGDIGITCCNYTLDATPKAGGETIHAMRDGKSLAIHERQSDGSWKIIYDSFNSNLPLTSEQE